MTGVIDDVFGFDNFTRDVIYVTQAIGQTDIDGLLATPKQTRKQLRRFFQTLAASFTHHLNKLRMDLVQQSLRMGTLGFGLWAERIQESFVHTSCHQATLHT